MLLMILYLADFLEPWGHQWGHQWGHHVNRFWGGLER